MLITGRPESGSILASFTENSIPSSVNSLSDGAFYGADILRTVTLPCGALPEVGENLLDGASAGIIIRVPSEIYNTYMTDYFWGRYESVIQPDI